MLFTGEFAHTIDAKQRLAIPAEIRAALARGASEAAARAGTAEKADPPAVLYSVPGSNGALWLWPENTFDAMSRAIGPELVPTDDQMDFDEFFFPLAARLPIDGAGRIRLPERLIQQVGLTAAVVILGVRDHLELRSQEDWESRRAEMLSRSGDIMMRARRSAMRRQNLDDENDRQ